MSSKGLTKIFLIWTFLIWTRLTADSLVLDPDRAVELALKNNYQVKQQEEKLLEVAAGKAVAFSSFLPQVSVAGSWTRLGTLNEFEMVTPVYRRFRIPVYDPFTGQVIGFTDSIPMPAGAETLSIPLGSQNNYLLRASVQQTLFTWGKLFNAYRIAGLSLEMQKAAFEQAKQELKTRTIEAFYQALLAEKTKELLTESYEQLARHVAQAEKLFNEGLATGLDVMRARVSLKNLANQVEQIDNSTRLAHAALRTLLGVAPETPLRLKAKLAAESIGIELNSAIDSALKNRPELVQLRQALRIAHLGVGIARTANLPTIFAAGNFDYKKPVGFEDRWGKDWNVTLGVSMPLFTGLSNIHKLKQAKSRYRQSWLTVQQVEQAVRLEVEASLASVQQEWRNIAYQQENLTLTQEAFELAEKRYQNGLLSNLEFLDIQLQLTQARVGHLNALANYQIARARFLRAIGKF
jgi:outer membrane protein TolC